jgi:hypothetical protein
MIWSSRLIFLVFCLEVLRKATIGPAFFPATINWADEFSRGTIAFLNTGHAEKRTSLENHVIDDKDSLSMNVP